MDVSFELNGTRPSYGTRGKPHPTPAGTGVTFEQAAEVFFDPLFKLVEAGRNDEARDAVIGFDAAGRVLFVVHIQVELDEVHGECIRIVSARKATAQERKDHDF